MFHGRPKAFKAIASFVGTRNATQVRTHAQKYFLKIEKFQGPCVDALGRFIDPTQSSADSASSSGGSCIGGGYSPDWGTSSTSGEINGNIEHEAMQSRIKMLDTYL
ncbi:hypothetical protein GUITHDRAFT_131477 [Guillardia theta CCMP2712]|uniref:HTH myb-type domain-containing protein n=1 Tax=Guillardia theta (strain CCMP2712) TaxID=905079 RepID=L1K3S7_GUITC|nr:hypothetical protein GUITHDRAFT_131477 [Guillardia theta CCMP2712]EKX55227.1 hypothetical protein GUITHDRAFT_131477 [Guillardia theta CCMP2712]|eukprot:XP_005842207.1 hypothetical protein GUITHDRAFT_131477 [Guillardia theta CCMP2712]